MIKWTPSQDQIASTQISQFMTYINDKCGHTFSTYDQLYEWSVTESDTFWEHFLDFSSIRYTGETYPVSTSLIPSPDSKYFPNVSLNYAENCLHTLSDNEAIVSYTEKGQYARYTYNQLAQAVSQCQQALTAAGVKKGDRVAAVIANIPEAIIGMLATASLGAIWSSCSPDFGLNGILDRFSQIEPKVLFVVDGYYYNGQYIHLQDKIKSLQDALHTVSTFVRISMCEESSSCTFSGNIVSYSYWINTYAPQAVTFEQVDFNHPLYILYSSGTTGLPKSIVHGSGGTLIQHQKELRLHCDLSEKDVMCYFTTCGWMMWNWMVSSLTCGAKLVLYDGSPLAPSSYQMWELIEKEKITVFGTSAKFIAHCQVKGYTPGTQCELSSLRVILSTGSPLVEENFDYVYDHVKADVQLSSISGGTDIVSCFALGCPILPVYRGELQCRGLGMNVVALDEQRQPIVGEKGELVCLTSFPSMPVKFWNDDTNEKYKAAYFDDIENVWYHGDYLLVNDHGGVKILGRSDTTLNPSGVRIGTAEIYRVVEKHPDVADSVVIGVPQKDDEKVWLFLKLKEGKSLDAQLKKDIRNLLKEKCSPRHVPSKLLEVDDIPYTISGKKVELAIKHMILGKGAPEKRDAFSNPDAFDCYEQYVLEEAQLA